MWLINTTTIELEYFHDAPRRQYAILSHTWEEEEVTFQSMQSGKDLEDKMGYQKIIACCNQAREDNLKYAWVDTCCIDKSSSAELSEAINSMYKWYQYATICYAYLADVQGSTENNFDVQYALAGSRWFSRGWTLQELLAPPHVEFYCAEWHALGTKWQMAQQLSQLTGIAQPALEGAYLQDFNVAQRMSWASERETTRPEDKAYCLLGIFGVNMPLLYGEGDRAFQRLQEQIVESIEDYTIFAWPSRHLSPGIPQVLEASSILANDPSYFVKGGIQDLAGTARILTYADLQEESSVVDGVSTANATEGAVVLPAYWERHSAAWAAASTATDPPSVTARGILITVRLLKHEDIAGLWLAVLCPVHSSTSKKWFCVPLTGTGNKFHRVGNVRPEIRVIADITLLSKHEIYCYRPQGPKDESKRSGHLLFQQMQHLQPFKDLNVVKKSHATDGEGVITYLTWTQAHEERLTEMLTFFRRFYRREQREEIFLSAVVVASLDQRATPSLRSIAESLHKMQRRYKPVIIANAWMPYYAHERAACLFERPDKVIQLFFERVRHHAEEISVSEEVLFALDVIRAGCYCKMLRRFHPSSRSGRFAKFVIQRIDERMKDRPDPSVVEEYLAWSQRIAIAWSQEYEYLERLQLLFEAALPLYKIFVSRQVFAEMRFDFTLILAVISATNRHLSSLANCHKEMRELLEQCCLDYDARAHQEKDGAVQNDANALRGCKERELKAIPPACSQEEAVSLTEQSMKLAEVSAFAFKSLRATMVIQALNRSARDRSS